MPGTPDKFNRNGSTLHATETGALFLIPIPTSTEERWMVASHLTELARRATEQAVLKHEPKDIVCPECDTPAFNGLIDDGHGNTIPCWRCNLLEREWDERIRHVVASLSEGRLPSKRIM